MFAQIDSVQTYGIDIEYISKYIPPYKLDFIKSQLTNYQFIGFKEKLVNEYNSILLNDEYFDNLESVFINIKECEDGKDIEELLEGPVCHGGFERLN